MVGLIVHVCSVLDSVFISGCSDNERAMRMLLQHDEPMSPLVHHRHDFLQGSQDDLVLRFSYLTVVSKLQLTQSGNESYGG